jgi:phage-related protein
MAVGFIYTGASVATPDKTLTRKSKPRVLVSKFGDGYEQRISDGINNITESYSVAFTNREKTFIDDVVDFLDAKAGVTKFDFTIPDAKTGGSGEQTVKVVCEDYSTNFEYDEFYTLTATFRRVYEA